MSTSKLSINNMSASMSGKLTSIERLMGQPSQKRLTLYLILALSVVVLSSGMTILLVQRSHFDLLNALSGSSTDQPYKHYGIFDGHDNCKKAIADGANGEVIALESDDRSALYQGYNDTNVITFSAEVRPYSQPFLSEQRSTYHVSVRCSTSAKTNKVVNLNWLATDHYGVK